MRNRAALGSLNGKRSLQSVGASSPGCCFARLCEARISYCGSFLTCDRWCRNSASSFGHTRCQYHLDRRRNIPTARTEVTGVGAPWPVAANVFVKSCRSLSKLCGLLKWMQGGDGLHSFPRFMLILCMRRAFPFSPRKATY